MSKELAVIEKLELVPFFTKGNQIDETLKAIEAEALAFVAGDLSVKKNQDAVKAMVTKVTKSKTYLEAHGKDLAAEYKAIPKVIDENRRRVKDFLTELQAKVRQPLTEYEAEQRVIEAEKARQALILEIDKDYEFAQMLMVKHFEEKAEAERLAEEQLIKERAERDALIAKQAKEQAEREAKEREELLIKQAADAETKAESDRIASIEREEKAKREAIAAEERRKLEAEQAIIREAEQKKLAEEYAKSQAEAAKQAEIKRQKDEADRQAAELARRESNIANQRRVNNSIKQIVMTAGCSEEMAIEIVKALVVNSKTDEPLVSINY